MKFTFLLNPQFYQTLFLFTILNIWIAFYGIHFDYIKLIITFWSIAFFDILFGYLRYNTWRWPIGGINASFGIAFFLRTDVLWLYVLAAFLAISSKYLLQIRWKHFFNPSNFGVFVTLCLFGWTAWTNTLQWGKLYAITDWQMIALFSLLFVFWNTVVYIVYRRLRVNLYYLIIPFAITHIMLYLFFTVENSWASATKFYTPAFLIFIFHMLTDPMIIMKNNLSKVFFGMSVAIWFYFLQYYINESYSLIASLFFMTMLLPIVRIIDDRVVYRSLTLWNVFLFCFIILLFGSFYYKIITNWYPDLVFENRCNALICQ